MDDELTVDLTRLNSLSFPVDEDGPVADSMKKTSRRFPEYQTDCLRPLSSLVAGSAGCRSGMEDSSRSVRLASSSIEMHEAESSLEPSC